MLNTALKAIFGSRNDRLLKEYRRRVDEINALEAELSALSDDGLRAKTVEFRERIGTGTAAGKELAQQAFVAAAEDSGKLAVEHGNLDRPCLPMERRRSGRLLALPGRGVRSRAGPS